MESATEKIRNAILGKYPLIYLLTWEEPRAIQLLEAFASKLFGSNQQMRVWNCVSGFANHLQSSDSRSPLGALQYILNQEEKAFYVLKDFSAFVSDPSVTRALRDAYYTLQGKEKFVFILSPELVIPESLKKEILLVDMDLPDETEL